MIISQKKPKASPVARLLAWAGVSDSNAADQQTFEEDQFRFEMEKEKARVDRQGPTLRFAVLIVQGISRKTWNSLPELGEVLRERLRITDTVGYCKGKLSLLLPETDHEGAQLVASQIEKIASTYKIAVDIEIIVYPDDDKIARHSAEFKSAVFDQPHSPNGQHFELDDTTSANGMVERRKSSSDGTLLFSSTPPTPIWKRVIDLSGSAAGLVLLSPVFVLASIAVKMSSRGPVFFRQMREGKDGVPFYIYKFRTMINNAEAMKSELRCLSEQDGPAFKIKHDPRLTFVGKYLRKSCIDELPQLVNVLLGQMSLVGPRPLPICESQACSIWQRKRLEVAPGLTCIWQVRGDRNTKFNEWMRMDMEYIRRRSFLLDLKLIFETVFVALLHRGSV